jgi:hypothetical protein
LVRMCVPDFRGRRPGSEPRIETSGANADRMRHVSKLKLSELCWAALVCAAAVVSLGSGTALAQGGSLNTLSAEATSPTKLKRAREQFSQALSLQTGGDWAGALTLLNEVLAVKATPQVRFNLALCEEHLGRLVAALGDYKLAAADAPADPSNKLGREIGARLTALAARVPRVVVQRGLAAESASVALDGVLLGDSVLAGPLLIDPGPHVVEASAAGFVPFKQSFRGSEGRTESIRIDLTAEPAKVDPPRAGSLPAAGAEPRALPSLATVGFVVGGVGVASLVASAAMFYARHATISDLDKLCGNDRRACPETSRATIDRGKLYTTLGELTLGVGAVGVGVGAALLFARLPTPTIAGMTIAPSAPGSALGASVSGRF